ncbi:MAG: homocysteine S-methyltransferase family protein, partial [Firmicutes bacterium]|nr:homocysteine S-methyltransferase family protein [Bacillota bacterium]
MSIRELLGKRIVICDGAMGTMIQKSGVPIETHPEMLNFTHPEEIKNIYKQYYEAGSDFISTNTFGANAFKMEGCGYTVTEIVTQAIKIAKEAADEMTDKLGRKCHVGLDIAPIGRLMEPAGDMVFDEAVALFKEQAEAGVKAGADLIVCETFTDIYELKAAIIAVREVSEEIPLFCSVSFESDGRMLMGTDPETMVYYLQDLGMDALGVNCSLGPKQMVPIVETILNTCKLPVLCQPNAGLPRIDENGETVFDVTIDDYAAVMEQLVDKGLAVAGACCGTSPDYIRAIVGRVGQKTPVQSLGMQKAAQGLTPMTACSSTRTVKFDGGVKIVGERINPTGKKLLKEALKTGDYNYIEDEAER